MSGGLDGPARPHIAKIRRNRVLMAIAVGTLLLFMWHGIAQFFPWGVNTASAYSSTAQEPYVFGASRLKQAAPETWTTGAFERELGDGISTLATDRSFAWIIAVPRERYNPLRYFVLHGLSQFLVATLLAVAVWLLREVPRSRRLALVFVTGVAGTVSIYGGMMNWWGLPARYGLGEAVNLVAGWMIALLAADRLMLGQTASRIDRHARGPAAVRPG